MGPFQIYLAKQAELHICIFYKETNLSTVAGVSHVEPIRIHDTEPMKFEMALAMYLFQLLSNELHKMQKLKYDIACSFDDLTVTIQTICHG
jgi:hypothetical protein